jgi:acyl carrier protein
MLELVAFVEETFGIKLENSELVPENLDSVDRVVAFIQRKRGETKKAG